MRLQFANGAYSLTAKEIERLIFAANNPRDRVLLLVLCETGIRRFEASAIAWENIDIVRRLLTVRNGKGGKRRVIPITERLSRELELLAEGARHEAVFYSRQAGSLSVRQVNRIVALAGRRAGIKHPNPRYRDVTCHLLRHTFARLWKSHEGSIESLSKILGHTSVKTTWDVYGTESWQDVQTNYQTMIARMYHWSDNTRRR